MEGHIHEPYLYKMTAGEFDHYPITPTCSEPKNCELIEKLLAEFRSNETKYLTSKIGGIVFEELGTPVQFIKNKPILDDIPGCDLSENLNYVLKVDLQKYRLGLKGIKMHFLKIEFIKYYDIDTFTTSTRFSTHSFSNFEKFLNSCKFCPLMWEAGIAPEFYDSSLTKKQDVWEGLISTQKLLNAHEYRKIVEKNQRLFVSKVHQKIRRMHTLDICHADLEVSNIVMANNVIDPRGNENFDIFFIDWDFSFNVSTISSKIINFFEFDPNSDMASQCFDHDMNQFNDSFERYIK
jgi:hypothetical protein